MLLMAKANKAVLLSFMGEAPFVLFFFDAGLSDPAIGFELNQGIANVC
jgi:hypothetical protein